MSGLNYWNGFEAFKRKIRKLGGVWKSDNVLVSQHRDGYSAAYRPEYPEISDKDIVISPALAKGDGNYVLVRKINGRLVSFYYDSIEDIGEEGR